MVRTCWFLLQRLKASADRRDLVSGKVMTVLGSQGLGTLGKVLYLRLLSSDRGTLLPNPVRPWRLGRDK